MRLIDYQDRYAAAFFGFGGERVGGLRDQGGVVEPGYAAEGGDHGGVYGAGVDGWVGQVDRVVAGAVEGGDRGSGGDGLTGSYFSDDDGQRAGLDGVGDAGDGLVMGGAGKQLAGGQAAAERQGGEPEVVAHSGQHGWSFPVGSSATSVHRMAFAVPSLRARPCLS